MKNNMFKHPHLFCLQGFSSSIAIPISISRRYFLRAGLAEFEPIGSGSDTERSQYRGALAALEFLHPVWLIYRLCYS
jgi:hypothetical protein